MNKKIFYILFVSIFFCSQSNVFASDNDIITYAQTASLKKILYHKYSDLPTAKQELTDLCNNRAAMEHIAHRIIDDPESARKALAAFNTTLVNMNTTADKMKPGKKQIDQRNRAHDLKYIQPTFFKTLHYKIAHILCNIDLNAWKISQYKTIDIISELLFESKAQNIEKSLQSCASIKKNPDASPQEKSNAQAIFDSCAQHYLNAIDKIIAIKKRLQNPYTGPTISPSIALVSKQIEEFIVQEQSNSHNEGPKKGMYRKLSSTDKEFLKELGYQFPEKESIGTKITGKRKRDNNDDE